MKKNSRSIIASAFVLSLFLSSAVSAQEERSLSYEFGAGILSTLLYACIGILISFLVFKIIDAMTPGHLSKQLAEEKNMALAVVVGLSMLGISIIIAAAIAG